MKKYQLLYEADMRMRVENVMKLAFVSSHHFHCDLASESEFGNESDLKIEKS